MNATLTFHKAPPIGISAWHRHWVRGQIVGKVDVPCGDCTLCCRCYDEIALTGDDNPTHYLTKSGAQGRTVLQQHADGSCIYLVDEKCSIYGRQPLTCKRFDCRMFLTVPDALFETADASPVVRQVRDNAKARFALVAKEPDDQSFYARMSLTAARLSTVLQDAAADATLAMATILAGMTTRRLRRAVRLQLK